MTNSISELSGLSTDLKNDIPVVGIGSSAGGLEALRQLFSELSPETGLAYVVIQHLKEDQESQLARILASCTRMKVCTIENGMLVRPDTVFVLPPGFDVVLSGNFLNLNPKGESEVHHLGIDFFFSSLSQNRRSKAIGVVLSGAGADGTLGLKAIKSEGGITIVQDPKTAKFDSMPRSAIVSGIADLILSPDKIAEELQRLAKHPYTRAALQPNLSLENQDHPEPPVQVDGGSILSQILDILLAHTHIDFSQYKLSTIKRRIERQMMLRKIETIDKYAEYLQKDADEVKALYEDIFIHVTDFFRDPEAFEALKEKVFPVITQGKGRHAPLRVWIPGCATGEEVYSIAITLIEYLQEQGLQIPLNIFAGDISEPALAKARKGVYADYQMRNVSQSRLERFFEKVKGGYKVKKELRDLCVFSRHDITTNPPIPRVDLVSCRNVLIYFSADLQKRVFPVFHYALNPEGFLWLGRAESPESSSKLFVAVDKSHKIFLKAQGAAPSQPRFSTTSYSSSVVPSFDPSPRPTEYVAKAQESVRSVDQVLLYRYTPPSVVVDSNFDVLQFRGRTVPYIEPSPGIASYNLLKMANPGILAQLRAAIQTVKSQGGQVRKEGVPFEFEGRTRTVNIDVLELNSMASAKDRQYLVVFEDAYASNVAKGNIKPLPRLDDNQKSDPNQLEILSQYNAQLLQELDVTRDYQQSLSEEYEAAQEELTSTNEELRSTNEELQSTNEELHSTNEELSTAKEELQASNEELVSTNEELQKRNSELEVALQDLERSEERFRMMIENVTDYAIFMLDPSGYVQSWNAGAQRIKGYKAEEIIGKHFSAFYTVQDVERKHPQKELDIAKKSGRYEEEGWRVRKDGSRFWANVVITAIYDSHHKHIGFGKVTRDLTERKRWEDEVVASSERFEKLARTFDTALSSSPDFHYIFDRDRRFTYVNQALLNLWGKTLDEAVGKNFEELGYPPELVRLHEDQLNEVLTGKVVRGENAYTNHEGKEGYYEYIFVPVFGRDKTVEAISGTTRDVTERKRVERLRLEEQRRAILLEQLQKYQIAIENERENFRNLFRQTPEMVCILRGPDHVFEFVNEAHVRTLGFDATGMSVRQAQPESVEVHGILDEVYQTGKTAQLHEISVTVTNRLRYFNLTYSARFDGNGAVDGIMILGVEVTDQVLAREGIRRTAEDLRESQSRLRALIDALPQLVWTALPNGECDYLSSQWIKYTGILLEEQLGFQWIERVLHPDDRARVLEHWTGAVKGLHPYDIEYRMRRYDGEYRWFKTRGTPIKNDQGEITYWFGTCTDIEDQKQIEMTLRESEEQFRVLANSIPHIAWTTDSKGILTYLNHRWEEYTGVPFEEARKDGGLGSIHPGDVADVSKAWGSALVEGSSFEIESRLRSKSGEYRWFMFRGLPVKNQNGEVVKWFGTDTDIHEQRSIREELSIALNARDEFLSIASHELRTPITSIQLQLQNLLRFAKANQDVNLPKERVVRVSEGVTKQVKRLTLLLEDLLDVSRIRAGKLRITREHENLSTLLAEFIERVRPELGAVGCSVTHEIQSGVTAFVDKNRIDQVLTNLVGNIVKYAPGKPVGFRLQVRGTHARIEVEDHGPGIQDKKVIFGRFERAAADYTKISGLGLGLYISRQIVEAHHGTIEVDPHYDQGSRFVIELPIGESPDVKTGAY